MTRTMWIAFFCLVGLGPAIAIKIVTRPAALAFEAAQDQSGKTRAQSWRWRRTKPRRQTGCRCPTSVPRPRLCRLRSRAVGDPGGRARRHGEGPGPALARCQRQSAPRRKPAPGWTRGGKRRRKHVKSRSRASAPVQSERKRRGGRAAGAGSSAHDRQKADRKRGQQPAEAERSLALPAGRHGKRFEVAGPFAEMQHVNGVAVARRQAISPMRGEATDIVPKVLYATKYSAGTTFICSQLR